MGRQRYGTPVELLKGRQWRWDIPDWSTFKALDRIDSPPLTAFSGETFNLHLSINEEGIAGLYMYYKGPPPTPKYTYVVGTTKGYTLKQMTAHSIPPDCKQCGHWNVVNMKDTAKPMEKAGDNILVVWFQFDEDTITPTGAPTEFMWTISNFSNVRIGPYYSHAFIPFRESPLIVSLKLHTSSENRSEVILSASYRKGQAPLVWFRVAGDDDVTIFETPAGTFHNGESRDTWPAIPLSALNMAVGRGNVIRIYVRFGNEALVTSAQTLVRQQSAMILPRLNSEQQFYEMGSPGAGRTLLMDEMSNSVVSPGRPGFPLSPVSPALSLGASSGQVRFGSAQASPGAPLGNAQEASPGIPIGSPIVVRSPVSHTSSAQGAAVIPPPAFTLA